MSDLWTTRRVTAVEEAGTAVLRDDAVATEEPLEIRVDARSLTVVMRTPGNDIELVAGLLLAEGIVSSASQIATISHCVTGAERAPENVVEVRLSPGVVVDWARLARSFFSNSSCGLCGKTTIEAVLRTIAPLDAGGPFDGPIPASVLAGLPGALRAGQEGFERTGGLHACAAFDREGGRLVVREDVGRHNAVDKVVGALLLREARDVRIPAILMVSGRAGFEIVQKAAAARVPVLCAVSAPTSLAVDLARELNLTLVAFLRGRSFRVHAGVERIALPA